MRTYFVEKARKDQGTCEACREPINAGDAYKYVCPRGRGKRKRHTACRSWRPSELTTSDKLSTIYGAQESLEDSLPELESLDDIGQALRDAAEEVRGASEEYEESASNMEEHFPGSSQVDEIREKSEAAEEFAQALEAAADEVEAMDEPEDFDHAGSVSHGTLRTEDLLSAFAEKLDAMLLPGTPERERNEALIAEARSTKDEERQAELVNETLIDRLNDLAPDGWYFGALEGDGSDFGFWREEDQEDIIEQARQTASDAVSELQL